MFPHIFFFLILHITCTTWKIFYIKLQMHARFKIINYIFYWWHKYIKFRNSAHVHYSHSTMPQVYVKIKKKINFCLKKCKFKKKRLNSRKRVATCCVMWVESFFLNIFISSMMYLYTYAYLLYINCFGVVTT